MGEALQKFLPLFPLSWRIEFFRVNLEPPASKDENGNIISYFAGRTNLNFIQELQGAPSRIFG